MNAVPPTFAPFLASIEPPTFCRRCNSKINAAAHTLADCETSQQAQAIAADLALNHGKALRAHDEAFARMMKIQINEKGESI